MRIRSTAPLVAALLLALALAGCTSAQLAYFPGGSSPNGSSLGSLQLVSALLGNHTLAPTRCTAGDEQFFLGGDFRDEKAGVVVRLVVDPLDGPAVRAFSIAEQFDKSVVFLRRECRVFHLSLQPTGLTINDVDEYRISLELDCTNSGGDALSGKASANSCN